MARLEESEYLCDSIVDLQDNEAYMQSAKTVPQSCTNYIKQSTGIVSYVKEVKKRDVIFYSGTAMQISFFMESLIASPHLTDIADSFALSASERDLKLGGYLQMCLFACSMPFCLIVGNLGDRFDRKRIIMIFSCIGAMGNVLMILSRNYGLFLLLRAITTASNGTSNVFMSIVAQLYPPQERAKLIGQYNAFLGVGVGLGVLISVTVGQVLGWRFAFVSVGLIQFVAISVFWCNVPNDKGLAQVTFSGWSDEGDEERLPTKKILQHVFVNFTNLVIFVQACFAGLPIALFAVFFLDFLVEDAHAPSKGEALAVSSFFGIGLVIGQTKLSALISLFKIPLFSDDAVTYVCISLFYTIPIIPMFWVWTSSFTWGMSVALLVAGFFSGLQMISIRTFLMNSNPTSVHSSVFSVYSVSDAVSRGPLVFVISLFITKVDRSVALSFANFVWSVPAIIFFFLFITQRIKS